jgi:hypothetical protein
MKLLAIILLVISSLLLGFIVGYYTNAVMNYEVEETKVYITDRTGTTVECDEFGKNCETIVKDLWK